MRHQLLIQSLLGHLSLLAEKYPKKANSPVARRFRQYAKSSLTTKPQAPRKAA